MAKVLPEKCRKCKPHLVVKLIKYALVAAEDLLIQERYRLVKLIGQGGFGKTFLAVDEAQSPAAACVIKQFWPQNQAPDALNKAKVLFEQEALRLEELGKHPQIPAILAHFEQDQRLYLVQEFIDGTNLAQVVEEEGAFGEVQIWQLLDDLLPVLKFIHERQVIHRDIKPENIIRRNCDGRLVLVDFGAAKLVTGIDQHKTGTSIGSPEYVAPEQVRGKAVFASDLYSLGVTCIYLLTQIPPFDLFDVANDCWAWRQYLTSGVSDRLSQILDKLLQNAMSRRFQSADEVMQALRNSGQRRQSSGEIHDSPLIIHHSQWQCLHTLIGHSGLNACVNSVAISPQGNTLASASDDKTIRLWDLNSGQASATLYGHSQAVKSVAFSPDGKILATGSDDRTIKFWDINTNQEICTLSGHSHAVKSVIFSPDGKLLASASWDKTIKLWNVYSGEEICTLTGHQLQVSAVAFSPQGNLLASAGFDRTIRVWELPSTEPSALFACKGKFENRPNYTLSGHAWAVLAVAFSPDGKFLATGSDDKTIKLWDLNTRQVIRTLLGHSWSVVALAYSSRTPTANGLDGETLISGSWDKTVKLWRVSTGEEIATLCGHLDSVCAVAFSPIAQLVASGSRDKTIKLWQLV